MQRTEPTAARADMTLVLRLTLAAYMLALGWIVVAPAQEAGRVTGIVSELASWVAEWSALSSSQAYPALEFVANVALFVPFGALWMLALPRLRPLAVIGSGLATSALIEVVQLALPSRFSSLSDVIANTLGTAVGVALVALIRWTRARQTRATSGLP